MSKIITLLFFFLSYNLLVANDSLKGLPQAKLSALKNIAKVVKAEIDSDESDLIFDITFSKTITVADAREVSIEIKQGLLDVAYNIEKYEKISKDNTKFRYLIKILPTIKTKKNFKIVVTTKERKEKLDVAKNNLKIVEKVIEAIEEKWAATDGETTLNMAKALIKGFGKKFTLEFGGTTLSIDKDNIGTSPVLDTYIANLNKLIKALRDKTLIEYTPDGVSKTKDAKYLYSYYFLKVLEEQYGKILGRTSGVSAKSDAVNLEVSYSERILNYKVLDVDLVEVPESRVASDLGDGIAKYFFVFRVNITNDSDKDLLIYGNTGVVASKTKFYSYDKNNADSRSYLNEHRREDIDTKFDSTAFSWVYNPLFGSCMSGKIEDGENLFFPIDNKYTLINTFDRYIHETPKYRAFQYIKVIGKVSGLFIPLVSNASDFPTGVGIYNATIPYAEDLFLGSDDVQKQVFLNRSLNHYEEIKAGANIDKFIYINKFPLQAVDSEGVIYFKCPIAEKVFEVQDEKTTQKVKGYKTRIQFKAAELTPVKDKKVSLEIIK